MSKLYDLTQKISFAKAKGDEKSVEELNEQYILAVDDLREESAHSGHENATKAFHAEEIRFFKGNDEPRLENYKSLEEWTRAMEKFHGQTAPTPNEEQEHKTAWEKFDNAMTIRFGQAWTEDEKRKEVQEEMEK